MIGTKLHWVDGLWRGRLAMAARPRGGEWLDDELAQWRLDGVDTVVSMLEPAEERELELGGEGPGVRALGMTFLSFPIVDRHVPESITAVAQLVDRMRGELHAGRNVVLHCRQGVGRTGLVAASLLMARGMDAETAMQRLSLTRGVSVPETQEQRLWIEHFAETLAPAR